MQVFSLDMDKLALGFQQGARSVFSIRTVEQQIQEPAYFVECVETLSSKHLTSEALTSKHLKSKSLITEHLKSEALTSETLKLEPRKHISLNPTAELTLNQSVENILNLSADPVLHQSMNTEQLYACNSSHNFLSNSGGFNQKVPCPRKLELLAPAKNLEVGKAALLAGADAVYIGGSGFGARAAAGNDLNDIAALCALAHRFGARVYLTVNTLLYDRELPLVQRMIQDAVKAGVDALIVQDPAILTFPEVQHLEIHASTQWNINTLDKVDYCARLGISQIVLPREFSLAQIQQFCADRPNLRFEVFVSGAMCVSISGECFISEFMTGRSANRGECAQICRLPMQLYREVISNKTGRKIGSKTDIEDSSKADRGADIKNGSKTDIEADRNTYSKDDIAENRHLSELSEATALSKQSQLLNQASLSHLSEQSNLLEQTKQFTSDQAKAQLIAQGHLLSMKDNLRLEQLERLVEAGATSFKIEGRLKDRDYVINQVAAFRERLDILIEQHPDLYARSSLGVLERSFTPQVVKTFNRGFTHAYLDDDNTDLVESRTPKSFGQLLGKVKAVVKGSELDRAGARDASKRRHQRDFIQGSGKFASHKFTSNKNQRPNQKGQSNWGSTERTQANVGGRGSMVLELRLNQDALLSNGDSFTFFDVSGELKGFRVNRVSRFSGLEPSQGKKGELKSADSGMVQASKGEVVYLHLAQAIPELHRSTEVYRNVDSSFIKQLEQPKAVQRKVKLDAVVTFKRVAVKNADIGNAAVENANSSEHLIDNAARVEGNCCEHFIDNAAQVEGSIVFRDDYGRQGRACLHFCLSEQEPLSQSVMASKLSKFGDDYVFLDKIEFAGEQQLATLAISTFNQLRRDALADYIAHVQLTRAQLWQRANESTQSTSVQSNVDQCTSTQSTLDQCSSNRSTSDQITSLPSTSHMAHVEKPSAGVTPNEVAAENKHLAQESSNADSARLPELLSIKGITGLKGIKVNTDNIPYLDTTVKDKVFVRPITWPQWPEREVDPRLIANAKAQEVFAAGRTEPLATLRSLKGRAVMTCRCCLIKNHAVCRKQGGSTRGFYLMIGGRRFDLATDCKRCLMYVLPHEE